MEIVEDDRQLRAMVSLIEAQAEQVSSLRQAVDKLEGLLALRAELDTMVAHEVRKPLTVVHGVLSTLQVLPADHADRDTLVAQAMAHTRRLSESLKHLLSPPGEVAPIVDRAVLEPVPFGQIADHVLDELSGRTDGNEAHIVLDTQLDLVVTTSPPRMEALLLHLLDHASQRAPGGIVELRAALTGDERLRIEVGDRGDALDGPSEDWFAPAVGSMGLYLARMLARSMAGDVTLADRPGGGCLALVELPQRRGGDTPPPTP
jgi:signal transduction histidine kinase